MRFCSLPPSSLPSFHEQVNYINAHATSLVGDVAEVNAVKKVFKDSSEIKMNATKVSGTEQEKKDSHTSKTNRNGQEPSN